MRMTIGEFLSLDETYVVVGEQAQEASRKLLEPSEDE
jgi:hypothetical protein